MTNLQNNEENYTQKLRIFPQRLTDNHRSIQILLKSLKSNERNEENTLEDPSHNLRTIVAELETILNNSLPQNDHEQNQHMQEFLHFKKDPEGYYQHLLNSKLKFLVLWTDYKYITKHFRVRNFIHIRWNGSNYECQIFDKTKRIRSKTGHHDTDAVAHRNTAESTAVRNT